MGDSNPKAGEAKPALNRRDFMRRAGAGAGVMAVGSVMGAAAAATETGAAGAQRAAKNRHVDYDVIVLGGGFAGVTAARNSSKNGYKTLVLEARDRLGGRTYTSDFAGHQVELGGTWIHWTQPFVWSELQHYGLEVIETPDVAGEPLQDNVVVLADGKRHVLESAEDFGQIADAVDKYFGGAAAQWERPYDASFQWSEILKNDKRSARDAMNHLDLSPVQRVVLESYVTAMAHSELETSTYTEMCRWWSLPGANLIALNDSVVRYRFKHGTISLINEMVEDGKPEIRLSTPVKSVDDRGDHVIVTTASGQRLTTAAVIVALPMNVLPDVQFTPPLDPLVVQAGRETHAGHGVKLLIKVKGFPVGRKRLVGLGPASHALPYFTTYAMGDDHIVLVMFGPDPRRMDYENKAAVQAALRDYVPDAVVEEVHYNPWTVDPYSKGTWATYRAGWFEKYYAHFQRDRGRVFFGQGDHGEGWRGFIDGAIGAGTRAADRVKTRLG
jgi:pseudooxynicotine oxidase